MGIQSTKAELYAVCRNDLPSFVRLMFPLLHSGQKMDENWHIDAVCYQLTKVENGASRRLMIAMPPRTMKSLITSVIYPAWRLGRNPSTKMIVISHNKELATTFSNQFRQLTSSDLYKSVFPAMSGAPVKDSEGELLTAQGGGRRAMSVDQGITGLGADMIILDDPQDASEAENETACDKVNVYYDSVVSTRLNNPATSPIILVQQRLSIYDLSAHLVSKGEEWDQLVLPAVAAQTRIIPIAKGHFHEFLKGDLLHPTRLSQEVLDEKKVTMGDRAFSAQYLQAPFIDGAGVVKWSEFQFFDDLPEYYDYQFVSIDAATGSDSGSYTVILLCRISNGKLYVYGHYRKRVSLPDLFDVVLAAYKKHKLDFIVVEKASSGMGLLELLRSHFEKTGLGIEHWHSLLWPIAVTTSKEVRMEQALVPTRQGEVLLSRTANWLPGLKSEFEAFPEGKHDDQVDAFSQSVRCYLEIMRRHRLGFKM